MKNLDSQLPLKVKQINKESDLLIIEGENWIFKTASPWRLSKNNLIIFGDLDKEAINVENLKNSLIISIKKNENDICFIFDNGMALEIFNNSIFNSWSITFQD